MVCQAGDKLFCSVREVLKGSVNDVFICYDKNANAHTFYTLLLVKQNAAARQMIQMFEGGAGRENSPYIMSFSQGDSFCFLLTYHQERPITEFFLGHLRPPFERDQLMQKLVMECIAATKIPYPVLHLILVQNQVNLAKDGTIYFTYLLDLEDLDESCGEEYCVQETARLICRLLKKDSRQKGKNGNMLKLLEKKTERLAYRHWMDLYKDLCLSAVPEKKTGKITYIRQKISGLSNRLFYILLVCCILLAVAAVSSVIIQALFGEVAWFRIFYNTFERIGTETLGH